MAKCYHKGTGGKRLTALRVGMWGELHRVENTGAESARKEASIPGVRPKPRLQGAGRRHTRAETSGSRISEGRVV